MILLCRHEGEEFWLQMLTTDQHSGTLSSPARSIMRYLCPCCSAVPGIDVTKYLLIHHLDAACAISLEKFIADIIADIVADIIADIIADIVDGIVVGIITD
jgi:hypothetical protein